MFAGGVFVVLLCGLALAILVAILEFCWNSKKNAQTDRQSLCSEMAEELRFAVRCHGSRQRPALRRSCNRCSPATTYVPAALDLPHLNGVSLHVTQNRFACLSSCLDEFYARVKYNAAAYGWFTRKNKHPKAVYRSFKGTLNALRCNFK